MVDIWRNKMTNVPTLEGYGCRLRPVKVEDAEFIVKRRNQSFAKGMIHATSTSVEKQIQWIANWQLRENDYYWIIETTGEGVESIGTIGLYDLELEMKEGMPGRWIMLPQNEVNIMAPFLLLYGFVFEVLCLDRVVMDVVADNKKVRRFHELYGARYIEPPARYVDAESEVGMPLVWFEFSSSQWPDMNEYWKSILEVF